MAAHTPLPPNLRWGLVAFSGSLFLNNKTRDSGTAHTYHPAHEVLASLPLQMMLYFNVYYFPVWCLAEGMMLQLKVPFHGAGGGGVSLPLPNLPGHAGATLSRGEGSLFKINGSPHTSKMSCPPQDKMAAPQLPEMEIMRTPELSRQGRLNWEGRVGRAGHQHGWELAEHGEQGTGRWAWSTGDGAQGMGNWAWRAGQKAGWDKAVSPLQYHLLPQHYQFLLVAAFLILSLAEGCRLYLGYVGNLQEKVPELAGFLLLSFLIQLPLLLFLLTDSHVIRLPLEMAVHSLFLAFLVAEIVAAFLALKTMTKQLAAQFYLRQFEGGRGRPGQGGAGS
ncbi:transmembrane protein 17B-like [Theristicus caerulescens]